jgi:hypothetical protein
MARNNKVTRIYVCQICSATSTLTGSGRPIKYCANCKIAASRKRDKARYKKSDRLAPVFAGRRAYIRNVKLLLPGCVDCGFPMNEKTSVCFDFDHRDPTVKRFELSNPPKWATRDDVDAEIEKCDLVCRNCHALRPTSRLGRYRRPQADQLPLGNLFDIAQ